MKRIFSLLLFASLACSAFEAKDYSRLYGTKGFSKEALDLHFTLYKGYVKNATLLLELLAKEERGTPQYAELKRRFGWEFDGMRLHELYFENFGGSGVLDPDAPLAAAINQDFGSFEEWKKDFIATGLMRGIGWAILYQDPVSGKLINTWINEHDSGHLAGGKPLLVMDVFEHAYLPDYQLKRDEYIQAFFNTIDWPLVSARFSKP